MKEHDTNLATKLEKDTKRWQNDGQDDIYAVSCAFTSHFVLFGIKRKLKRLLEKRKRKRVEREI